MKLRVKPAGGPAAGRTTVELSDQSNPTLFDLRKAVVDAFYDSNYALEDVKLSLNKKDVLSGDNDVSLASLGIRGGDLLYLLDPTLSLPAAVAQPLTNTSTLSTHPEPQQQQQQMMEIDPPSTTKQLVTDNDIDPSALAVPLHLLRTLQSNPLANNATSILVLSCHAALTESGFKPSWITEEASLQGNAIEAMYCLPASCRITSSVIRLEYTLPFPDEDKPDARVTLTCSVLGSCLVAAASINSDKSGTACYVALKAADYIQPGPETSSQWSETTAVQGEGSSESIYVTSNGHGVVLAGGRFALGGRRLRSLWNTIKDGLCFSLTLAAYAQAGLPPPAGLLALPTELKLPILELLPALDLAALSGTCTEFRHQATMDDLWRPLLDTDFPAAPEWIKSQIGRRGAKWCYAQCYRDRREREEEAARARRRRRNLPVPFPHLNPRPPYYPANPPPGFPGMIGGDHDRLPFLGGTSGVPGLGGGLPGGMFFGRGSGSSSGQGGFRLH